MSILGSCNILLENWKVILGGIWSHEIPKTYL